MTNPDNRPERIWVKEGYDSWGQHGDWYAHGKGGGVEYVPASLLDAASQRVARLEEAIGNALDLINADFFSEAGNALRTALAETKESDDG